VAWGYARGAGPARRRDPSEYAGSGHRTRGSRLRRTAWPAVPHQPWGAFATRKVLCAVAGYTPRLLAMVGLRSPIYVHPLQAMVSEPLKPLARSDHRVGLAARVRQPEARARRARHGVHRSTPTSLHSTRSTLGLRGKALAAHMLELFPFLSDRERSIGNGPGWPTMTPDFAPIMGIDAGAWLLPRLGGGVPGASRRPRCAAKTMSHTVAKDAAPSADRSFRVRSLRALRP